MSAAERKNYVNPQINAVLLVACHPEWADYMSSDVADVLNSFFSKMAGLSFINQCVLWTCVEKIVPIAQNHGFHYLHQDLDTNNMPQRPYNLPASWKEEISRGLQNTIGTIGNIQIYVDAAHIMLQAETLEKMFDVLMEDENIHEVVMAEIIEPHLYLETEKGLSQLFDHPGLDRQKIPPLYRACSAYIRHGLRAKPSLKKTKLFPVSWSEALTYNPVYSGFFK